MNKDIKLLGKLEYKSDRILLGFILYERKGYIICRMTWKVGEREHTDERNFGSKTDKTVKYIDEWVRKIFEQVGIEYKDKWQISGKIKTLEKIV